MRTRTAKAGAVTVKSSMRTLEVLEYCDSVMRSVTITELADKLGYPQSSTSTLVQSMLNAGYLVLDPDGRGIAPSSRVSSLGRWIEPAVPRAEVKAFMQALGTETGQTILLGVPHDLCVRYIDVVPGRHAMRLEIPIGSKLPLVESGMGRLLLSQMSDDDVAVLVARTRERVDAEGAPGVGASDLVNIWNADPVVPALPELLTDLAHLRRRGFEVSLGRVTLGAGIVCVPLPRRAGERPMGVGVGGLSTAIAADRQRILRLMVDEGARLGIPIAISTDDDGAREAE
ncbi:IclR family transcriptional regulator [Chelatococcus reniformis]|uniref:Transcriptional regulator n=1 Tax=Chelatococcus reniformis TaxID=1494448 RepID=A0A916UX77_9HYPH|nr:helix-turn-helix domain-containing protein [Chelatococcus reniformis]GGC91170.1 transcriptional regulator [Chelatococcus reniformis]